MQRSRDLTRGFRWNVLALVVIYYAISLGLGLLSREAQYFLVETDLDGVTRQVLATLIEVLLDTPLAVVGAVGVASLYHELRTAKEGPGKDAIASVFD